MHDIVLPLFLTGAGREDPTNESIGLSTLHALFVTASAIAGGKNKRKNEASHVETLMKPNLPRGNLGARERVLLT